MGRYSLSGFDSARICSAFLTAFRTYGLPLLSRYAPTPRLILRGSLSALNASVTPKKPAAERDRRQHVCASHRRRPRSGEGSQQL